MTTGKAEPSHRIYYTRAIDQFSESAPIGPSTNFHLLHVSSEATGLVPHPQGRPTWRFPLWTKDCCSGLERTLSAAWRGRAQSKQQCSAANERGRAIVLAAAWRVHRNGSEPSTVASRGWRDTMGKARGCARLSFPFVSDCGPITARTNSCSSLGLWCSSHSHLPYNWTSYLNDIMLMLLLAVERLVKSATLKLI